MRVMPLFLKSECFLTQLDAGFKFVIFNRLTECAITYITSKNN